MRGRESAASMIRVHSQMSEILRLQTEVAQNRKLREASKGSSGVSCSHCLLVMLTYAIAYFCSDNTSTHRVACFSLVDVCACVCSD
jgi:hypothetical protein